MEKKDIIVRFFETELWQKFNLHHFLTANRPQLISSDAFYRIKKYIS